MERVRKAVNTKKPVVDFVFLTPDDGDYKDTTGFKILKGNFKFYLFVIEGSFFADDGHLFFNRRFNMSDYLCINVKAF